MLSRFKKNKKDEGSLDASETLEEEDEGLFMSAGEQDGATTSDDGASAGMASQPPDVLQDSALEDAQPSAEEGDNNLAAPATPSPESSAENEEADTEEAGSEDGSASSGGGDDLLSAFRDAEAMSDTSGLLKGVEDVSMDEILAELREVREMMGITEPAADDSRSEDAA